MTEKSLYRPALFALSLAVVLVVSVSLAQPRPPGPPHRPPAVLKQLSVEAETAGLQMPFKGISANGTLEPDLFHVHATGVATNMVRDATDQFLLALTPEQRARTVYDINNDEWRKWMNQSFYVRQGVSFDEMNEMQRTAAFNVLKAALSAKGLKQTRDIMHLNTTLAELSDNTEEYGEGQYYLTVMGRPSKSEPWGFQFDGHHAVINYFVLGDQVVMTPFFAGSEPVIATSGKYQGTQVLQDEQGKGLAFINALDDRQKQKAILKFSKTGDENLTEAWKDNVVLDYAGLPATALSAAQQQDLLELIGLYVGNMDEGHAKVKMEEVKAHLNRTYFAWIGKTDKDSVFYYRIHSPVLLIEFDHQRPVGLRHLFDPNVPFHEHIHTVMRTPNGNDYGKDLLRQHYLQQKH